jgi:anaerobic selenocysteine-containing dehydrogenase
MSEVNRRRFIKAASAVGVAGAAGVLGAGSARAQST